MKAAVLGYGNMGSAITEGLLNKYQSEIEMIVYDKFPEKTRNTGKGVKTTPPEEWFNTPENIPDVVITAVKPQDIKESLKVFSGAETHKSLWISVAAGVKISTLTSLLKPETQVCRVMPNMPALKGEGMSAYAVTENVTEENINRIEGILSSLGEFIRVKEETMDAVTGLSGSGPAYVFTFIEALTEGGVAAGLKYDTAQKMAIQTIKGSIEMISAEKTPGMLKASIMSPGGTTVKGVQALERNGFRHSLIEAVTQAAKRSKELS